MDDAVHMRVPSGQRDAFIALVRPNALFPGDALDWTFVLFDDDPMPRKDAIELMQSTPAPAFAAARDAYHPGIAWDDYTANWPGVYDYLNELGQKLPLRHVADTQPCVHFGRKGDLAEELALCFQQKADHLAALYNSFDFSGPLDFVRRSAGLSEDVNRSLG
jgi:hypothetical protein